jgi:hypothetical protein
MTEAAKRTGSGFSLHVTLMVVILMLMVGMGLDTGSA